jgi:hypothetical protein
VLKNLLKYIIAPIIVLVVGGYSSYHFTKQDESREINPHSNSGIINNMSTNIDLCLPQSIFALKLLFSLDKAE